MWVSFIISAFGCFYEAVVCRSIVVKPAAILEDAACVAFFVGLQCVPFSSSSFFFLTSAELADQKQWGIYLDEFEKEKFGGKYFTFQIGQKRCRTNFAGN